MRVIKVFAAIMLCAVCAIPAHAQDFKGKPLATISIADPLSALRAGETLNYSMEWLGIPVGKIILKTAGITTIKGHKCYLVIARSFPNRFFRRLYDLEYKVYSFIDTQSLASRRFVKVRRYNKKINYTVIDFDQEHNKARFRTWGSTQYVKISKKRTDKLVAPPTPTISKGTQDLLSALYYFRLLKISANRAYPVPIYYEQSSWPLFMRTGVPFSRDIRDKGSFPVMEVAITSDLNEYILGKHKFLVFLTVDQRRTPIEFRVGTSMGYIRGIILNPPE